MADERTRALIADIAAELAATEELPVERSASRWMGEAQAVAADLADGDPDAETVARRTRRVRELLENVEETGHAEADERVTSALSLTEELLARVGGES